MFWLCLHFPQLALESVHVDARVHGNRPLAIVDGPLQHRHVVLADAAALKAGVRSGHTAATAQMLCPRLLIAPRDPSAERQALESLASWGYRFSAEISVATADTVFLEVGRSLVLFGGWPALERRLRAELDTFGFACSLAAAPTAAAARVLAMQTDGVAIPTLAHLTPTLGAVALLASGLGTKTITSLRGMGFRHLRDLFRLPRAELARRIGESALDHLDRMRGLVAEALPRWHPPQRFERHIEFSYGVESQAALAFPLQRLIRELATFLIARDGGVQRFTLVLGHERGASTRLEIGLLAPQRDAASLFELARARLERIDLPAPVHALHLLADDLPPLCPLHRDLFDTNRREQLGWPALAERLRARLGDTALHGLASAADHRPARAWRFVAAIETVAPQRNGIGHDAVSGSVRRKGIAAEAAPASAANPRVGAAAGAADHVEASVPATAPGPRPAAAPIASARISSARGNATALDAAPEPATRTRPFWLLRRPLAWRETSARILAGPERIESGWWDERDQRRDYYIVETRRGQRAWAFVEAGSPVATGSAANWTLHGWFA